jgi:hypothetical protein
MGRELRGPSTTTNEAFASAAVKREGGEQDEWCGEEEDRHLGDRAGGDAWAVGLRERPTICAYVERTRSIIKIYSVLEAILIDVDVTHYLT